MDNKQNPYFLFNQEILESWVESGVKYVRVSEMDVGGPVKFYELIPDPDFAGDDPVYPLLSEDIMELVEPVDHAKFVVHEVNLDMEEE